MAQGYQPAAGVSNPKGNAKHLSPEPRARASGAQLATGLFSFESKHRRLLQRRVGPHYDRWEVRVMDCIRIVLRLQTHACVLQMIAGIELHRGLSGEHLHDTPALRLHEFASALQILPL